MIQSWVRDILYHTGTGHLTLTCAENRLPLFAAGGERGRKSCKYACVTCECMSCSYSVNHMGIKVYIHTNLHTFLWLSCHWSCSLWNQRVCDCFWSPHHCLFCCWGRLAQMNLSFSQCYE